MHIMLAYVSGIHRINLATHFNNEVTESITHRATVRSAIVKLGGEATTDQKALKLYILLIIM